MTAQQEQIWQNAAAVPTETSSFKLPNGINGSHFIAIVQNKGLYHYDFNKNIWNKYHFINKLPTHFDRNCNYYRATATIDINNKRLHFLNGDGEMAEVQITEKEQNKWNINKSLIDIGEGSQSIIIKDEWHLIGGSKNNKQIKYNSELNKFDVVHSFNDFVSGFCDHQIVSFNNNVFIFGGYETKNYKILDTIYHCNIGENIWNKLNIKMAKPLYSFGCSTAINNKYILIFGGRDHHWNECDEIYIFSLLNQSFTKSKVHCPEKGRFYAITINDILRDEMALFGYVREQWKLSQMTDHYFPPNYLLKMMHSYYLTECIHLFGRFSGKHWKMSTFDIVS